MHKEGVPWETPVYAWTETFCSTGACRFVCMQGLEPESFHTEIETAPENLILSIFNRRRWPYPWKSCGPSTCSSRKCGDHFQVRLPQTAYEAQSGCKASDDKEMQFLVHCSRHALLKLHKTASVNDIASRGRALASVYLPAGRLFAIPEDYTDLVRRSPSGDTVMAGRVSSPW